MMMTANSIRRITPPSTTGEIACDTGSAAIARASGLSSRALARRRAVATADAAATVSAAGAQSAYAPAIVRKQASNIALFLAGRKNIRDAIILNEILNRPEARW